MCGNGRSDGESGGTAFRRAYCQAPQCGPTRASVLSGLRPTRNRFFRNGGRQPGGLKDIDRPDAVTMPQFFRKNGYTTVSLGKVYHSNDADLQGWSERPWKIKSGPHLWHQYPEAWQSAEGKACVIKKGRKWRGISCESADVPDDVYQDGQIAEKAVSKLGTLKPEKPPFFLAVGFLRPHLPFNAPKKYWDMYDPEEVRLAENPFRSKNAPEIAFHNWPELRALWIFLQTARCRTGKRKS